MGRRRRKVIRFPKKHLPKQFMCPNCGYKAIKVNIENIPAWIRIQCGKCGNMQVEKIGEKKIKINCFECGETIAEVKVSDTVEITCGICNFKNFFEVTDEWSSFNCHCPPSKQSRFRIIKGGRNAVIRCGHCGLYTYLEARKMDREIDIYNRFFDGYHEHAITLIRRGVHV